MKIVHVCPTYVPVLGGAELLAKEISERLASRGHEVTVLTVNVRNSWELWHGVYGGLPDTEIINGVKVRRFHPSGQILGLWLTRCLHLPGGWRSLGMAFGKDGLEMLTAKPFTLQLIPYLVRSQADIVMAMNWHWSPAYHTYLARKLKSFMFVGMPLFHTAVAWSNRQIYKRMLATCNAVVANTVHEARFVQERGATRVTVAGVGVHRELFERPNGDVIRARYSLGSAPVVGFVGRQQANKGVAKLVEAMGTVWQWNPEVRLVLAGHGSKELKDIEVATAIERLGSFERQRLVRINEFDEKDKASLYDAFDVLALPSTEESFGLAYLEAWMCQKPVIGSRIGSTACVIEEGTDGLLVEPNDPRDIARAIIELLGDPDRRARMGERGYAKTIEHFTWEKVTDRVERLYLDLIAETPIPRFRRWSCGALPAVHTASASSQGTRPDGSLGGQ